jgi:hypothetical protein
MLSRRLLVVGLIAATGLATVGVGAVHTRREPDSVEEREAIDRVLDALLPHVFRFHVEGFRPLGLLALDAASPRLKRHLYLEAMTDGAPMAVTGFPEGATAIDLVGLDGVSASTIVLVRHQDRVVEIYIVGPDAGFLMEVVSPALAPLPVFVRP